MANYTAQWMVADVRFNGTDQSNNVIYGVTAVIDNGDQLSTSVPIPITDTNAQAATAVYAGVKSAFAAVYPTDTLPSAISGFAKGYKVFGWPLSSAG